jgi:hypothetical protein
MSSFLRRCIDRLPLPKEQRQVWIDRLIPTTFGQLGEDAVIDNHLGWLGLDASCPGMYLDIGAHHPTRGSNTYRFYRRGSWGFAVDIGKRKQRLWQKARRRDHFIDAAVVPDSWPTDHVLFSQSHGYGSPTDSVRDFGVSVAPQYSETLQVPALRAGELVARVMTEPAWEKAPFRILNCDIEGLDEKVLLDLQLDALKPDVIAVESFLPVGVSNWDKLRWYSMESPLVHRLVETGYALQSVCGPTLVFVRIESWQRGAN